MLHEVLQDYPGDLLSHLRAFVALASRIEVDARGAFDSAAASLHIDSSVLRRRMQALADYATQPLWVGRGRRMKLTPTGELLRGEALLLFDRLRQLQRHLSRAPLQLSVGCTGTISNHLLPQVVIGAQQRWPQLQLRIRRAGSEQARQQVEQGELDLAVIRSNKTPLRFACRRLCGDQLWLAVPRSHPLTASRIAVAQLAVEPIISFRPHSYTRGRVMQRLGPLGGQVRVEVDGRAAALRYVEHGLGIAFLSQLPGGPPAAPKTVALRDVTRLFPKAAFYAIWLASRAASEQEDFIVKQLATGARARTAMARSRSRRGSIRADHTD